MVPMLPGTRGPVKARRTNVPAVVEARSFALIDNDGNVAGTFSVESGARGVPAIKLTDSAGREVWRIPETMHVVPLMAR